VHRFATKPVEISYTYVQLTTLILETTHMNQSSTSAVYLRFLNLLNAIEGESGVPDLEANERVLLDMLARRWHQGKPVTVLEAMNSGVSGMSPSTVHRRIKSLKSSGMLRAENDTADSRTKYLVPTEQAMAYFDRLGDAILKTQVA
jgi:hypothetical protein